MLNFDVLNHVADFAIAKIDKSTLRKYYLNKLSTLLLPSYFASASAFLYIHESSNEGVHRSLFHLNADAWHFAPRIAGLLVLALLVYLFIKGVRSRIEIRMAPGEHGIKPPIILRYDKEECLPRKGVTDALKQSFTDTFKNRIRRDYAFVMQEDKEKNAISIQKTAHEIEGKKIYAFVLGEGNGAAELNISHGGDFASQSGEIFAFVAKESAEEKALLLQKSDTLKKSERKLFAVVVGESGSGKSLMMQKYSEENPGVLVFNDYRNSNMREYTEKRTRTDASGPGGVTVILDQFERCLADDASKKWVRGYFRDAPESASFVLVCKEEAFSEVLREFDFKRNEYNLFFFKTIEDEREEFKKEWLENVPVKRNNDGAFHDRLLEKYFNGSVRIIEMNIVRRYLAMLKSTYDDLQEPMYADPDVKKTVHAVIDRYFDKIFDATADPTCAMMLTFAICCYGKEAPSNVLANDDFRKITFADNDTIRQITGVFCQQVLIQPIGEDDKFTMTHDYLARYLDNYCANRLPAQIVSNIRYYCICRAQEDGVMASAHYDVFHGDSPQARRYLRLTRICATALSIAVLVISLYFAGRGDAPFAHGSLGGYFFGSASEIPAKAQAAGFQGFIPGTSYFLLLLAVGGSICYVYHYLVRFAVIFLCETPRDAWSFLFALLVLLWGSATILGAFLFSDVWAVFLGSEFICVGLLHHRLSKRSQSNAQIRFRQEGNAFCLIGLVIMGMNGLVLLAGHEMLLWYVIYSIFLFFSVRQHINREYLLAKLGSFYAR